ncbi:MAG: vitamin K epoxide reductase family protein [Nanoarchaeota archaeon]
MQSALILTLSILGLAITIYITIAHILKKKIICPIDGKSCNKVLDSKYSRTLGIKNEIIGFSYYLLIIAGLFIFQSESINLILKMISPIAMIYSIILFGIQIRIIKSYCFWCISTAIINILLFISIINS